MNRQQRRKAAKLGGVVNIGLGRCLIDDETVPQCYACNKPAPAWEWPDGPAKLGYGIAVINDQVQVPVCQACLNDDGADVIARKFLKAPPDLQIEDGGGDLSDVLDAMKDKATKTAH